MDIKPACSSCVGTDKCSKYCVLRAGSNLVNFVNGIDVVETQIGEFRKGGFDSKINSLIISGHMIESGGSPTYILTDLSTSIDISGKFNTDNGMTPVYILKSYLESIKMDKEVIDASLKTFKRVNSNKLVPVPLKPGAECEVTYQDANGKEVTSVCKVKMIKWTTDKKTGKIECTVLCPVEKGLIEEKCLKIPLTEYGTTIRLPHLEHTLKSSEIDRELLVMTHMGFIKPIVVSDGKYEVAIDGQYLYRIIDGKATIVGTWQNGKIVDVHGGLDLISRSKAYKRIKNALTYIEKHKRFIAPLGLFEANSISV